MFNESEKDIQRKISKLDGLGGMTVNERLYLSGLMDEFDKAIVNNKGKARQILTWLKVDEASIAQILDKHD